MELVLSHFPMILFSTLVPMASGAFIGLAIAFMTTKFSDGVLARIDRWTLLPMALMFIGLIAEISVLTAAQQDFIFQQGLSTSTLTILAIAGATLLAAFVVYWAFGATRHLGQQARAAFSFILAICALLYSLGIAALYATSSVATWASPMLLFAFAGYCIAGGVPLGVLVVALGGGLTEARATSFPRVSLIVAFIGVASGIFAEASQLLYAQAFFAAVLPSASVLPGSWVYLAISIVGYIVMLACLRATTMPGGSSAAPVGRTAGAAAAMPMAGTEEREPVGIRSAVPLMLLSNVAVLAAIFMARVLFHMLAII